MKQCPRCRKNYSDDTLNFCLDDGELLTAFGREPLPTSYADDEPPPTVLLDQSRVTNPASWPASPPAPVTQWQAQNLPNRRFSALAATRDQTIPTISMILGICSIAMVCCFGGLWLGLPAAILGYMGMRNADSDPSRYGGRGMAVASLVIGIITLIISIIHIFFTALSSISN